MDDLTEPIETTSVDLRPQPSAADVARIVLDRPDAGSWGLMLIPVLITVALCVSFMIMN